MRSFKTRDKLKTHGTGQFDHVEPFVEAVALCFVWVNFRFALPD